MENRRLFKVIDSLSYFFLALSAFITPLFVDKNLVNFYIIPKQYVFIGLVLLSLLFFGLKVALTKTVRYHRSFLDAPVLILLGLGLLSAIFSTNVNYSFFGRNEFFVFNFVFLLFLVLSYFLTVNTVKTKKRWQVLLDTIILSGGLTALFFILKVVFKVDFLSDFLGGAWNTIDKINSPFGFMMIFVFVMSAGQLIKKSLTVGRAIGYFFVALMAFTSLVLLSFNMLWWVLLIGVVFLLILGANFLNEARIWWLSSLFVVLILTLVFIVFGSPKSLQSSVPVELSLGLQTSWTISVDTTLDKTKNFLLGSGLGTFGMDFSQFRPESFNYDQTAWSLRFGQPYNTFLAILAESGVVMSLFFVFLVVYTLGHITNSWFKNKIGGDEEIENEIQSLRLDVYLIGLTWLLMTVAMFFSFFGPVAWILWWILLGMLAVGLSYFNEEYLQVKTWQMQDTPQYSLAFSFVSIVVIAVVIMTGIWGSKLYLAEIAYSQALKSTDLSGAEGKLIKAIEQRPSSDIYYAGLAQVYLMQASNLSAGENPDMNKVSALVAQAVNAARHSTELSPRSVSLWENLANMYENAALIVPDSRQWALNSWEEAKNLEPTNPVLHWRLANNYAYLKEWDKALENYGEAVKLKTDYIRAYIDMASVYEQKNEIGEAVKIYEQILPASQNNVDLLYNYGRLLYNRDKGDDRDKSEQLWLAVVSQNPSHSNALYSLGLLYESWGQPGKAVDYYYKVKELNPGNKDISNKINSLFEE